MKVWQLKKINEYAQDHLFDLDYKSLIVFCEQDIDLIVTKIDEGNDNIKVLIDFFDYVYTHDWEKRLLKLVNSNKEPFNFENYIIQKILEAPNSDLAFRILWNSLDIKEELPLKSVEEWKQYVENIKTNNEFLLDNTIDNLNSILNDEIEQEKRIELIKTIMDYSQMDDSCSIGAYLTQELITRNYKLILELLIKGYKIDALSQFIELYDSRLEYCEECEMLPGEMDECYEKTIDFLKNIKDAEYIDLDELIKVFVTQSPKNFYDIISCFEKLEKNNCNELYEKVIKKLTYHYDSFIVEFIEKIFKYNEQEETKKLYNVMMEIITNHEIFVYDQDKLELLLKILERTTVVDKKVYEIDECLILVKNINLFSNIIITKENRTTREIILKKLPELIAHDSDEENCEITMPALRDYYTYLVRELSKTPFDICTKIFNILITKAIKDFNLSDKEDFAKMLFDKNNRESLDYIYEEVQIREKEYEEYEKSIDSQINKKVKEPSNDPFEFEYVINVLAQGYDLDKVLEGFSDEDEIKPKTLIRSTAYKNNQN